MARTHATNITSMPQSVEDERRSRMIKYLLMMGIRAACLLALIWLRGPWMLVAAAGAIFLPYFAVVMANAVAPRRRPTVERPNVITPLRAPRDSGAGTSYEGEAGRSTFDRGESLSGEPGQGEPERGEWERRAS